MYEFGWLDSEYTCLTHYDLDPRNIMVDIQPDGTPTISGIIDWDLACFAPEWVSCKPPMWIWNWLDGGSEDESQANNEECLTVEQKELKRSFYEAVGYEFRDFAYQPHYRIARALFKFARFGCPSGELREEAERACEEWEVMYRAKQEAWEDRQREGEGRENEVGSGDGGSELVDEGEGDKEEEEGEAGDDGIAFAETPSTRT